MSMYMVTHPLTCTAGLCVSGLLYLYVYCWIRTLKSNPAKGKYRCVSIEQKSISVFFIIILIILRLTLPWSTTTVLFL